MRKFLLLVAVACVSSAMAQLTTREAAPNSYKLGAYPQAGDLSLMFSVYNITNFDSAEDDDVANIASVNGLGRGDLITGKYYWTDQVAFRVGIKLQREVSNKSSFETDSSDQLVTEDPDVLGNFTFDGTFSTSSKDVVRDWAIKLGIEKHFNSANFFDVYAGADLYLGLGTEKFNFELETEEVGEVSTTEMINTSRSFKKFGVLPFIGVQMFVLDLPVSIGVEYGWDALWKFGGLYKTEYEISQDDGTGTSTTTSGTYYSDENLGRVLPGAIGGTTIDGVTTGTSGSSSSSMLNTNQNVKILLNIYFGRGGSSSSDVVIE